MENVVVLSKDAQVLSIAISKSKPSIGRGVFRQKATPFLCNFGLFPMPPGAPNDQVHLLNTSQYLVGVPRYCLKSFWSLKVDFGNDFQAKTPKLYSASLLWKQAIDFLKILVETP